MGQQGYHASLFDLCSHTRKKTQAIVDMLYNVLCEFVTSLCDRDERSTALPCK
jgi:hypothetical protein